MLLTSWLPSNCDEIRITSDEINALYSAPVATNPAIVEVTHNCSTDYTYEQARTNFYYTLGTGAYVRLRPADLDPDTEATKLDDGIYNITITIEEEDGSKYEGSICVYLGCDIVCDVVDYLAANLDSDAHKYIQALEWVNTCDSCQCENACIIFDYLTEILEGNVTESPCNCA